MIHDEAYWTDRYLHQQTQWDIGYISTPLKAYFDQLTQKNKKILIPGCGNAYEAAYLHEQGFTEVFLVDISSRPLEAFSKKYPAFPAKHLVHGDFFELNDTYDLIVEQTFFCALHPSERQPYAEKMHDLLSPGGRLVGVLFEDELFKDHPPYGGDRKEYENYFLPYFEFHVFERCYNSIKPRAGRELFINLAKKN